MKKSLTIPFGVFLLLATCCSEKNPPAMPARKFIETAAIDSTIRPGDNFFLFVNGKWIREAVIPATESYTGIDLKLDKLIKENVKIILDETSTNVFPSQTPEQKVGDFYASGMDSITIEKQGYDPIKPILQKIEQLKTAKDIIMFEAERQRYYSSYLTSFYVGGDAKNNVTNILNFYQCGLGLPDRDYYFKNDKATLAIQKAYQNCMKNLFMLTGSDSVSAVKMVTSVFALEKQIASSHKINTELLDPIANYHKKSVSDLNKEMPVLGWAEYLKALGITADSINIGQPAYYSKVNELLKTIPIDTWKGYLKFNILIEFAPALSSDFIQARFEYIGKALNGLEKIRPRWERIFVATDNNLTDALGQLYVKRYFPEAAKVKVLDLVNNLQKSFDNRISKLDWMSNSTKLIAKNKLASILKKIGYPDTWKDYSNVTIDKHHYVENILACRKNEAARQFSKVGKPIDKTEWEMSPPTINAYYTDSFNEIVFPAGILQYPYFDIEADDAVNYGAIGVIIGHEMTHGFDDSGAQFDKDGNLKNWWTPEDYSLFKTKSKKVINLYSGFTMLDSLHVNGELTIGENIADIGGLAIAYDAFKLTPQGKDTTLIDGLTPDQRFFLSYAGGYRIKSRDEVVRQDINTDRHSPPMHRVNGVLMNFTPFYNAFKIQPDNKMYLAPDKRITIW